VSIRITKKTKVITRGFTASAMTLGPAMSVSLSHHTVSRILCAAVMHGG
jgi:hypothetical protein